MLAYAASRPRFGARQSSPNTLLFVACGHIALLAVAMSVKMALPPKVIDGPTKIIPVSIQKPPPPRPGEVKKTPAVVNERTVVVPKPVQDPPLTTQPEVPLDLGTPTNLGSGDVGTVPLPPLPKPTPQPLGISRDAQLLTSSADIRPPYPQSKLLAGEEAALRLRLTIDEFGRVTAVDPVGRADAAFLTAARKHLLSRWRYKPAMKDGQAVPTSVVITLRFQLDG